LLNLEAELLKNADYFTVLVHLLEKGVGRTSLRWAKVHFPDKESYSV
jgi:hypothetical protein